LRAKQLDKTLPALGGTPLFEVPIVGPLPEDLNYISTASPSRATAATPSTEGSTGTSGAALGVPLPWAYGQQLRVNDHTADNDGATSGNLTVPPGEASKTCTVPVEGNKKKANETFFLPLWEAGSAFLPDPQGIGTILDDNGLGGKH
jgi:hypothetical protein